MAIPKRKKYIADFEQLGFGMFVHWGLYSQLGQGEWVYYMNHMNMAEYQKLAETFTAEDFNAEKMVLMAKNAGCKYIVLTTRHHEGFSLYDTFGLNKFDAPHSASGRDLVREYVDACNKHGILPFFYHTTLDWFNEDYEKNFDEYLIYLNKSVEILCSKYGKIGGFWFDGNWDKPDADWKVGELYKTIRKYQPEAMIINNTGLEERGRLGNPEIDSVTFEQGTPTPMDREGMEKYVAAEMCLTVNDHWGYGKLDLNYKSPKELIEELCLCRKVGANLLLNIGPEGQGKVNAYQTQLFALIGEWMNVFGEAIYCGRPYKGHDNGRNFIMKSEDGKYLYIVIMDPGSKRNAHVTVNGMYSGLYEFEDVTDSIEEIHWMDNNENLKFTQSNKKFCVDMTGMDYGYSYCVRIAKATIKNS